jgi:glycosyltransferase involved in cell wall biosynthesis
MDRLCVVLCTYQGEQFLEEQLASIAAQTRLPDSLVIVDDHSRDATPAIARSFAARAPFPVRVVENEVNLGFIRNFERGISLAEGELIVLADQDDVWRETRLERIDRAFASSPASALVFSDAELVDAELRPLSCRLSDAIGFTPAMRRRARGGEVFELLIKGNIVTGATMAFRSEYRPLLLPLSDQVEHDAWIALLLSAVAPATFIEEPLLLYRQHAGNQIGARPLSLHERLERARSSRLDGLVRQRARNLEALERLGTAPLPDERREMLSQAIAHLDVRSRLPDGRAGRILPVLREIANGRYRRMSTGFASACRDLLV